MIQLFKYAVAVAALCAIFPASAAAPQQAVARNVVLVHSALVDGSSWRGVYDVLTKVGYRVSIVAHTQTSLAEDVAATRRVLDQQDGPTVLVGASYGGSIITVAGDHPKVSALVYVAAMQPEVGESLIDLATRIPAASKNLLADQHGFLALDPGVFRADFGADLSQEEAQFRAIGQMPLALAAASAKTDIAAWHHKPSYAIVATEDRLINPELQRSMYKRGKDVVTEIRASHAVFLSQPRAVARVIEAAAGEAGKSR